MTDEAALIAAVLKFPVEDTPRLAYADWLDELAGEVECGACKGTGTKWTSDTGQKYPGDDIPYQCDSCSGSGRVSDGRRERAEFIRVQVEMARLEPCNIFALAHGNLSPSAVDRTCDCRWHALRRREEELFGPVSPCSVCAWHAPIQHWPLAKWEWSRGFVSAVEMDWNLWRTHAAAIAAVQPVETVRLTTWPEHAVDNGEFYPHRLYWFPSLPDKKYNAVDVKPPIEEGLLALIWNGITFELPAERERTPEQQADDAMNRVEEVWAAVMEQEERMRPVRERFRQIMGYSRQMPPAREES